MPADQAAHQVVRVFSALVSTLPCIEFHVDGRQLRLQAVLGLFAVGYREHFIRRVDGSLIRQLFLAFPAGRLTCGSTPSPASSLLCYASPWCVTSDARELSLLVRNLRTIAVLVLATTCRLVQCLLVFSCRAQTTLSFFYALVNCSATADNSV